MVKKHAARRYMREIKALLPGAGIQKKAILDRIGGTVEEYLVESPDADYKAIVSRLGSPDQIAASCLEEMDTGEVMKKLHTKKRIVCIVNVAAVAVVLLWAGVVFAAYEEHYINIDGQFDEYIIEGTDIPGDNGGFDNETN